MHLWGKDLYSHLRDVYANRAAFTIMFMSVHYASKLWTNHERESAQARAFKERREYILPVRFDDTEIPGMLGTVGFIDLRTRKPGELAELIEQKIGWKGRPAHRVVSADEVERNRVDDAVLIDIPRWQWRTVSKSLTASEIAEWRRRRKKTFFDPPGPRPERGIVVAIRGDAYSSLDAVLEDVFLGYLAEHHVLPYSYGSSWVLAGEYVVPRGMRGIVRSPTRVVVPVEWLAHRTALNECAPTWTATRRLEDEGLTLGSRWCVMAVAWLRACFGLATNDLTTGELAIQSEKSLALLAADRRFSKLSPLDPKVRRLIYKYVFCKFYDWPAVAPGRVLVC